MFDSVQFLLNGVFGGEPGYCAAIDMPENGVLEWAGDDHGTTTSDSLVSINNSLSTVESIAIKMCFSIDTLGSVPNGIFDHAQSVCPKRQDRKL